MIGPSAPTDAADRFVRELADMRSRIADLERARPASLSWQTPSFQNGWTNLGSGNRTARYRLGRGDMVRLEGTITGGTLNAAIFTLPASYRPTQTHRFGLADGGVLQIAATGVVTLFAGSNSIASFNVDFPTS
jgi:hypothetical protein